tara:strand:- start:308 stop:1507 length:1200 start_codon:yes stop_codon:yes gene_type:complete
MKNLKNHLNIKIAISALGLMIGISLFLIHRTLIKDIREETNFRAKKLIELFSDILNEESELKNQSKALDILQKEYNQFIESLTFPIIISNKENECIFYNIEIENYNKTSINCEKLKPLIIQMDKKNNPIPITYAKDNLNSNDIEVIQLLHFGDPLILNEIIMISFITISFFILFIIIFIWGFYYMKSNERDLIYVGMAKETAHQLGTPLSSIFGWIELLKEENINPEILLSLKKDVTRISEVADRFSKIGSKLKLEKINIIEILYELKTYFDKRLSKKHKINLKLNNNNHIEIHGDKTLLFWAFENIIKNSIDSIGKDEGTITIELKKINKNIILNFIDNGKGISRKNKINIFRAGYSTKPRGWGLGLSLTKRILENIHLGQFSLISSTDKKTIFRFKL